jgi:deoxyadenosine/deoxycytidine kinase
MTCKIISIEGNIGSGKSTFISFLKKEFEPNSNVIFLPEPVDQWTEIKDKNGVNMIEKFYANQEKYAFSFQMMAYISRIHLLRKYVRENPGSIIITERSVYTDKNVFAKMLHDDEKIEEVNYQIYLKWFDEFTQDLCINHYVYIKTDASVAKERVDKRARLGETIPYEYLERCSNYHNDWLMNIRDVHLIDGHLNVYNETDFMQMLTQFYVVIEPYL